MGTPALGKIGIRLESISSSPGELVILPASSGGSPYSATTQPISAGMRLRLQVWGNSTTGTVAIQGTVAGSTQTETTPTIPIPPLSAQAQLQMYEYTTTNVFTAVAASGITLTGLTNGVVRIVGIAATNNALPAILDAEPKFDQVSFDEARGILDMHTRIIQTISIPEISKLDQILYLDESIWAPYMAIESSPATATIPASPTALKTSTNITTNPQTISGITAPSSPGMLVQLVLGTVPSAGTITINGTSAYTNASISETLSIPSTPASQTVYGSNLYSGLTSVVVNGWTSGTVTVNGVFAVQYTFTSDNNNLYTASLEWFTGTESRIFGGAFIEELTIDGAANKEITLSAKGQAMSMSPIGDRTLSPMNTSQITSLTYSQESPQAGWQVQAYIDALGGTPLTTAFNDVLDWKLTFKTGNTPVYTSTNSQQWNRLYRKKREVQLDATIDFLNLSQYENFRKNNKLYFAVDIIGPYIGFSTNPIYKRWQIIVPVKYQTFKEDTTPTKEKVEAKITGRAEYDATLGYSHKLICINQMPPTYGTP